MTLVIYCAGGLGKEIVELARGIGRWDAIVFVDDITDQKEYRGCGVYRFEDIGSFSDSVEFAIANGEPVARKALYEKIKGAGYSMATLISPYTAVLPGAVIGEGCILWDCGISADVKLAENVLVNTRAIIGHDAQVGAHSVISANCFLGGKTALDECVYMSPGSMVKDRISIGEYSIISLGAVVLRNARARSILVGNPARRVGENAEKRVFGMFD
ncbi:MAG: acetyltransferase [Lachnospiraceae bacterium]|nr:acetyltransferase [Lachnospiraceae bacterium]